MPLGATNPSDASHRNADGGVSLRDDPSAGIDEQRVVTALEANIIESDTIQGSEVSEQRQRNHIHYAIDRLGNERANRSHHISADVWDGVESQKAYYQEAFTSNRKTVRFMPENNQDVTSALATEYVHTQFMDKNDGYGFLRDSFHDAFIAKRCVAKVEWVERYEIQRQPFQGLTGRQLLQLQSRPDVVAVEVDRDRLTQHANGTTLVSGWVDIEMDLSYSDLELVQPERYFRDPNVSFVHESAFAGYQEDIARHELIDMGFDEDEVMELNLDYRFRQNEEDAARKAHDSTWSRARRHKRNPEQEIVTVYWHWAYLDMSQYMSEDPGNMGIGGTKLYKFCWSQGRLLTLPETMEFNDDDEIVAGELYKEEEDGFPFFEWTQYKIAHSEFGLCEADLLGDIQFTKSNLRRLIIDNQAMANTSRWKARHGFIKNPRELLDNNIGSVLWVRDMDSLEALETPTIRPESFSLLQNLDMEKENRTGMSSLAKGLNSDAISHQNAADMIQRLTNASNRRVLRGVRDYAETFLKPILMRLYDLGIKYDTQDHHVEINGEFQVLKPQEWPKRKNCKVQVALTPDQGREQASFLLAMHDRFNADPQLKQMYTPQQKHNLVTDVMDLMDAGDISRYLLSPASEQYKAAVKRAQELENKQLQIQQQQLQFEIATQKREDRKVNQKGQEVEIKKQDHLLKKADIASDNLREDDKFAHQVNMDFAELGLEATQDRPARIGE